LSTLKSIEDVLLQNVAQVKGREFGCPKCGLTYNRNLNAYVNIAHALMRVVGWGSCEPTKPVCEG